jgi:cell division protease FtsH
VRRSDACPQPAAQHRLQRETGLASVAAENAECRTAGPDLMLRLLQSSERGDREHREPSDDTIEEVDDFAAFDKDPAIVAAAILCGHALAGIPTIFDRIRDQAPVLILACPDEAWVEPTADALEKCFGRRSHRSGSADRAGVRGDGPRALVITAQTRKARSVGAAFDRRVASAFRHPRPLIGVVGPERIHLPEELERAHDERAALGRLRPTDLTLVARYVGGALPSTIVPEMIAAQVDPIDLRLAIHPMRGAEGALDRLRRIVERRLRNTPENTTPKLSELHGYGAAKAWGLAAASDLEAYKRNIIQWSACDPGVLLSGPPGTGKTLFASALAREAAVPFLAGSLAQWQSVGEAHLGTTLSAMRGFFRRAGEAAPCVALVDELDSFGDRRDRGGHNHHYLVQVINGFLECLDGADGRTGVLLVGATNDVTRIDPAILRSGRVDRVIEVQPPTLADIAGILRHHLGSDLPDADLRWISRMGFGGTGADCAAWVRRARGRARRAGRDIVEADLLQETASSTGKSFVELDRRAAYHEGGHAVVAWALKLEVGDMALRSPGHAGDAFIRFAMPSVATRRVVEDVLAVLMAGRAAEILVFGAPSTGAEADLAIATQLARDMHLRWGLVRHLAKRHPFEAGIATGSLVEEALQAASHVALDLLAARRGQLERVASALTEKRSLAADEVAGLLRDVHATAECAATPSEPA